MPVQVATTFAMSSSVTSSRRSLAADGSFPGGFFFIFGVRRVLHFVKGAFEFGEFAVLDFAGALEVAFALGLLELGAEVLDLPGHLLRPADLLLFFEPSGFEMRGILLDVGEVFFEL